MKWIPARRDPQLDPLNEYLERLQSFRQTLLKRQAEYEKELQGAQRANDMPAATGARELLANLTENLSMVHKALTVCRQVRDQIEFNRELRPPRGMETGETLRNLGDDLQCVLNNLAVYNSEVLRTIDQQLSGNKTLHRSNARAAPTQSMSLEDENNRLALDLEQTKKGGRQA